MKNETELNRDILKITMTIAERFPELSKYIAEMPVKISETSDPGVNIKSLSDYYNSLDTLLQNYTDCYNAHQKRAI